MGNCCSAPAGDGDAGTQQRFSGKFRLFADKMRSKGCSEAAIAAFQKNYEQLESGDSGMLGEGDIEPVASLPTLDDIKAEHKKSKEKVNHGELLQKTAVLKLNGGLGTGMGLEGAKSLLQVKSNQTFLDLTIKQVKHMRKQYKTNITFILMNSFSTSDDTKQYLKTHYPEVAEEELIEFVQNISPKVDLESKKPANWHMDRSMEWCPPGHGDIYAALVGSGHLDKLLEKGIKYLFVSNSDNLGATMDLDLLQWFAQTNRSFIMEVARRTAADKKGGHLCVKKGQGMCLRESAQCPEADEKAFQDTEKYKYFNTNNLWVNLDVLKEILNTHGGALPLPVIRNVKTVDPRNKSTPKVIQLETAMGAAIECFPAAGAVMVPRSRFSPVKTCNDLFTLRSDAYTITKDHRVELAVATPPVVKLDDVHYKMVDQMELLVDQYPSLRKCESLTIKGACKFDSKASGIEFAGKCTVTNETDGIHAIPNKKYRNQDIVLPAK